MPAPLVHIGYHRTGTTWFQERFYPAAKGAAAVPRKLARKALIEPNAYAFSPDRARAELDAFGEGRRLLICEENLSGYLHNGGFNGLLSKEVARRLHATFPEAHIVAFIRAQPRMIEAFYAQYVRAGGTHSIERYLRFGTQAAGIEKYWYKYPRFSFDHLLYQPLLEDYRALFRERVHVYPYERFAADQLAFVRAFARTHEIDIDTDRLDFGRLNPSLSAGRLRMLARMNLFTARSVPDKRYLVDVPNWYRQRLRLIEKGSRAGARGSLLSAELKAWIDTYYGPSNRRLAAEWELPLAELNYPMGGKADRGG